MKKIYIVFILLISLMFLFPKKISASCESYDPSVDVCYTASGQFVCTKDDNSKWCCTQSANECNPNNSCTNGACVPVDYVCARNYPNIKECTDQNLKCGADCHATSGGGICECYNTGLVKNNYCTNNTFPECTVDQNNVPSCSCVTSTSQPAGTDIKCKDDETGINTAIGCINVLGTPETFLADILRWAVGIGGGIAFLLILYAGFMIMTSAGNPERLKAGQELLTSAISGLILLIFSIFILKFIGVDILGLGAFGFGTI